MRPCTTPRMRVGTGSCGRHDGVCLRGALRISGVVDCPLGLERHLNAPLHKHVTQIVKIDKVLLIEDNSMNRQVVRDMFAVAGLGIDEAASGAEGLQLFELHDYDLLLVDLRMPGMDGFSVMKRIRARDDAKGSTPIIVVSGEVGLAVRSDCLAAGADDLIKKPVAMEAMFESIGAVIASRSGTAGVIY